MRLLKGPTFLLYRKCPDAMVLKLIKKNFCFLKTAIIQRKTDLRYPSLFVQLYTVLKWVYELKFEQNNNR